jgi:hypothetical protein
MSAYDAYLAGLAAERKARRERLADLPIVTVTGLVGHQGSRRLRDKGHPPALSLTLGAWRVDDERTSTVPMVVEGDAPAWSPLRAWAPPGRWEVIRFRAHLDRSQPGVAYATLVAFRRRWMRDRGMTIARISLKRPVSMDDPVLGPLTFDGGFSGSAPWLGVPVEINLATDHGFGWDNGAQSAQATAHAFWADQAGWTARLQDAAVAELLDTHNDTWRGDDAPPLTPDGFKARMRLERIEFEGHREFTAYFNDGGLLYGHTIVVAGDLSGPNYCAIWG